MLMPGRQARVLPSAVVRRVQSNLSKRRTYERDLVIFMLSFRAGLRACEIAQLEWSMLTTSDGRLGEVISVRDNIAKMGSGRTIPIHAELKAALRPMFRRDISGPVIRSLTDGQAMQPNSIVNWFVCLYREAGAQGCSSHSGRRTFITHAARNAHKFGASLRDVQLLAGHKSIEVTQGYIDGDTDAQRRLIRSL